VESRELTRKAIESILGDIAVKASAMICKTCGRRLTPSQPGFEDRTQFNAHTEEMLKSCTEALEEAEKRCCAQSEARARAEQMAQAEAEKRAALEAELQGQASTHIGQLARMQAILQAERQARAQAEARACAEANARAEAERRAEANLVADCECCEKGNIQQHRLFKIDSGQRLCSDCLNELKRCANSPSPSQS
jgi:membrane protein involved in colicin uptake